MNVLIVSRYCAYPSFHGSAQHAQSFSNELIKNEHCVEIVTGEDVEEYEIKYYNKVKYHLVPIQKASSALDSLLSSTITSKSHKLLADKIFSEFAPTIVHFGATGKMLSFLEIAEKRKIPTVAMMHDFFWVCLTRFKIENNNSLCSAGYTNSKCVSCIGQQVGSKTKLLNKFIGNIPFLKDRYNIKIRTNQSLNRLGDFRDKINLFIAQTQDHVDELILTGVKRDKIKLIPQGLSKEKLKIKTPNKKINEPLRIGYFGRVSKEKNVGVFVKSLNLLSEADVQYNAVFIAYGMTKGKIEEIANVAFNSSLNIEVISSLKEAEEVSTAISSLDVCVITSSTKESPRCLLESLAQKVPCVIANILGNKYLINDNVNGRVFEYNNPENLKAILHGIILKPDTLNIWKQNIPIIKSEEDRTMALIEVHQKLKNK